VGVTREEAVHNRERILEAAERLFREKGVDAVGLVELMKEAGFTQGGFYNHFASKQDLVSQVIAKAVEKKQRQRGAALAQLRRKGADLLIHYIRRYLSPAHRDNIEAGCPIVGFAGEIPHLSRAAQASYADGLKQMFNQTAQLLLEHDPALTREKAHARAISLYSQMVGSLLLSRAVSAGEPALADKIIRQGRSSMLAGLSTQPDGPTRR
jgi:TetR/AcrR family transcriptional repressor of nem operon